MNQNKYVVFDCETTGLDTNTARITELAIKVVDGDDIIDKSWLIKQVAPIPQIVVDITGITDEMCNGGVDLDEALTEFREITQSKFALVGHNIIKYDIPLVAREYERMFGKYNNYSSVVDSICGRAIDTAGIIKADKLGYTQNEGESSLDFYRRVLNTRAYGVKFNLSLSCEEQEIDVSDLTAHRAGSDVEMTYRLYKKIYKPAPKQDKK